MGLRKRPAGVPAPADPKRADEAGARAHKPPRRSLGRRACACCCVSLIWLLGGLVFAYAGLVGKSLLVEKMPFAVAWRQPYVAFNFAMMRLFRDIARIKARRRRFAQKDALMQVFLWQDKPLPLADVDGEGRVALTAEELAEYDGRQLPGSEEKAPLYLAILGRIYDVSAGKAFYGPGRTYHGLTGKDASRAFCTGCLEPECLISSLKDLTETQRREADKVRSCLVYLAQIAEDKLLRSTMGLHRRWRVRCAHHLRRWQWVELYEHHDQYKLVGRLRVDIPEATDETAATELLDGMTEEEWEMMQVERSKAVEGIKKRKLFRPK